MQRGLESFRPAIALHPPVPFSTLVLPRNTSCIKTMQAALFLEYSFNAR
jgi:hypothetical protein